MKYIGVKNKTSHLEIIKDKVERHVNKTARDLRTSMGMIGVLANRDSTSTKTTAIAMESIIGVICTFGEERPYRSRTMVAIFVSR